MRDEGAPRGFRDESGQVARSYLDQVVGAIEGSDPSALQRLAADLHEADLADLVEALEPDERPELVRLLGHDFHFTVLTEVDDGVREQILKDLGSSQIALGLGDLDSDDAVRILEDLEKGQQETVLSRLSIGDQIQLRRGLDYPDESAGRLMQTEFVAVPSFWSVGQTIDHLRDEDELPDFYELFVVDPAHKLVGAVPLNRFLQTRRSIPIGDLVDDARHMVSATTDREEVARLFERYNLLSMPVVDEGERMVGVIMVDDVLDVIQEEADEDIRRLSGIGDEEISDSVRETVRSRVSWLVVNLGTAVLASLIIGALRSDDRADGRVGRADADRRLDGRQRGHADHDRRGARTRDAGPRQRQRAPDHPARDRGRSRQRRGLRRTHRHRRQPVVRQRGARRRHRGRDGRQHAGGGLAGILIPLALQKLKIDPARRIRRLRHDGHGRRRLLRLPRLRRAVVRARLSRLPDTCGTAFATAP